MGVILYSTNCPKCNVLKKKLSDDGVDYTVEGDVELMKSKGFTEAPMLEVDGNVLNFKQAVDWLKRKDRMI